ncbi:Putative tagatose-6-phosphate ketose/aldose isomerase [Klebsiella michiganensis]|nr:Putative tagatose-6-phosphate ketose/aldose isomerase [Klebsiella michiganensis]
MSEIYTPAAAATGTWTEEEIRQQPVCWMHSLKNIDNIRPAIDNFLTPLLRKKRSTDHPDRSWHFGIYR